MQTIKLRLALTEAELLDASEDLRLLLEQEEGIDLCPACRQLLFGLNDGISGALGARAHANETDAAERRADVHRQPLDRVASGS